ncbi:MAG TPA: chlorophyll synthase ChlG [Steroidobacteraceae bacterium]|nr:chlorophyll synthase ChlG [Steroidobacteraceae bacterium]
MSRSVTASPVIPAPDFGAALELLKPITWFPPMWAFGCGIVSASANALPHWWLVLLGVALCGPLVCGTSQAVNDWFDREVDALNEPSRPIPSGRMPGRWGLYIAIGWTLLSACVALAFGTFGFFAALAGLLLAWLYSAPPIRLKRNGWWGNAAVAACYEGLPWVTGVTVVTQAVPDHHAFLAAALYSVGAHGIMTLNDFKSVAGDRQMGVGSLPVRLGVERAARLACWTMAVPQLVMVGALLHWQRPGYAIGVWLLLVGQLLLMRRLLLRPRELAPWYNGTGIMLYVLGMLLTAIALRPLLAA